MTSLQFQEIRRLLLFAAMGLIPGLLVGYPGWGLGLALAGYIVWSLAQLFSLERWIRRQIGREDFDEPPEATGLWGEVFFRLYRLMREQQLSREQLNAVIARAQESVTALKDAVILVDSQGQLEFWNRAAEKLLGFRDPNDRGQMLTNLIRDPKVYRYLKAGKFEEPLEVAAPANERVTLHFFVTRFGAGDRLIIVRDVSRIHQLEQMRKDFVANVSHELKTPLTVIKGYLETLLDTLPPGSDRLRRALEQMSQQSRRMEALIVDLLLLAKLEATEADNRHHMVMLEPLLSRLARDAAELAGDKHHQITVEVDGDARLQGDAGELESAFGNLLTNAVKYTPDNGHIQVRWWQDDKGGHLAISDDGIGIDPQHIPRLTERFYRTDNSRVTSTGGTGLGLAIVKHVVIRHDGRLEIRSAPGQGSTFTCHFPLERLAESPQPQVAVRQYP